MCSGRRSPCASTTWRARSASAARCASRKRRCTPRTRRSSTRQLALSRGQLARVGRALRAQATEELRRRCADGPRRGEKTAERGNDPIDVGSGYGANGQRPVQHAPRRQAPHHHQPVQHLPAGPQFQAPVTILRQRRGAEVDGRRQATIEPDLLAAPLPAPGQRPVVHLSLAQRLLQLVGAGARQEHPGKVRLDDLDLPRAIGVAARIAEKDQLAGGISRTHAGACARQPGRPP